MDSIDFIQKSSFEVTLTGRHHFQKVRDNQSKDGLASPDKGPDVCGRLPLQ